MFEQHNKPAIKIFPRDKQFIPRLGFNPLSNNQAVVAVDVAYPPALFGMPIVLAVTVFSHNLVPRAETIGLEYEYYIIVCTKGSQWLLCSLAS